MIRDLATRERHVFAANRDATLTLGELRDFIARLDAEGAAECTPLRGKVSFRGRRLLGITATIVRFGDPERRATLARREASLRASGIDEGTIRMMRP